MTDEDDRRGDDPSADPALRERARHRMRDGRHRQPRELANVQQATRSPESMVALVHELETHRVELELQNEDLRTTQEELADARDRYADLYENAPVAYLTITPAGRITGVNRAAERRLGAGRDTLVGQALEQYVAPESGAAWLHHLRAARHGSAASADLAMTDAHGERFVARPETAPAGAQTDGGSTLHCALVDVTARHNEAAMRDAKAAAERLNAMKSRFLAAAGHDLRQPLQALELFSHSLNERLRSRPEAELAGNIRQAVGSMRTLLDGILDLSRLDAGMTVPEPRPVAVDDLMSRLAAEYRPYLEREGGALRRVACRVRVDSDPVLLERILRNLLNNAVSHAPGGRVLMGCRRQEDHVRLEVWDDGPGIPPGEQDAIFEEFRRGTTDVAKGRGLGLGLAIVRRLAHLLDHPVTVRSRPWRATVFGVTAPRHAGGDIPAPADTANAASLEGCHILVVEDDPSVRDALNRGLAELGARAADAACGEDALLQLGDGEPVPDAVIADYHLGGSETGDGVITALRQVLDRPVPAVLLTGDTTPETLRHLRETGLPLLHKPVTPEALRSALGRAGACGGAAVPDGGPA